MKTLIYCILIVVGFSLIVNAQISYKVEFEKSKLQYELKLAKDGESYQKLTWENLDQVEKVGAPNLPVKFIKLIIPAQQEVDKIKYTFDLSKKQTLSNKIFPTQPDIPTSIEVIKPDFVKPDPNIYESEKIWPEKIVEFVHSGYLDNNNHIITLQVIPFQYYPKLDQLEELDNIQIELSLKSNSKTIEFPKVRTFETQEIWDNALKSIVDNKDDILKYQQKPLLTEKFIAGENQLRKPDPCQFYEYTIITSSDLEPYFTDFVNYKNGKGLNIGVVTTGSIYNEYNGDQVSNLFDNAGRIRAYLNDLWELGGTWVLLAGDFSVVPIRYGCGDNNTWDYVYWASGAWHTIIDGFRIPADLYFADRNGNWNVDGDQYTGEVTNDSPDYYPEFFVGRLLCTTGQEISDWSDKVILYEQNPGNGDPDYVVDCFMFESDQMQDGNQAEAVRNHLPSFNTTIWREQPGANILNPTSPTAHQVLDEMNSIYGFYGWFGHGAPNGVTTMSAFHNEMPRWCLNAEDAIEVATAEQLENQDALDNLTNFDSPAIIYSIGCDQTPFDDYHTNAGDYNLGESFTVNNLAGGTAFLGNTRFGWVYSSYHLFEDFADLIEGGNRHLGVAELISKNNNTHSRHYLSYSHNLIGCPETRIHTSIPMEKKSINLSEIELPKEFKIIGNYPNPFNPSTNIKYVLPCNSDVEIKIYDIMGSEIRTLEVANQATGYHEIMWNGESNEGVAVASGIYIYTLKAKSLEMNLDKFSGSSKFILLK
ncbi:MAG: T9SS type A sorting domain-containing protein [Bacteroidetes bacterium]|nr:T9SS type A sorting domain-containing protein [Bacteroidota bacterium]MBU1116731.1 T9SS type A sorting domain-containing protein [Bacteroidota bacterium]MBU1798130.1 T9SS type A sorting domain-containing protein [Bacteroidota bacterium]